MIPRIGQFLSNFLLFAILAGGAEIGLVRGQDLVPAGGGEFSKSTPVSSQGRPVQLQFLAEFGGQPLTPSLGFDGRRVSRLDYVLSSLAFRRTDGSWLESQDWFAYISGLGQRTQVKADGVPAEKFTGLRFRLGLTPEVNGADPNSREPGHALHPDVCGLHWGWQGGYVFLALEGSWPKSGQERGGFSYHLANNWNAVMVELPVAFDAAQPNTIDIALDVQSVLAGLDFAKDGESTHSRKDDPLAAKLKHNVASAFRVLRTRQDHYQEAAPPLVGLAAIPAGATPLTPLISQRLPRVTLPKDNPLTVEGVKLGHKLFNEKRLSINNTQSCASCHDVNLAFADARRVSLGAEGKAGRRNAMPLFNLAWGQGFFWDGRAATLRQQVVMPIVDASEMHQSLDRCVEKLAQDSEYPGLFRRAFGAPEIDAAKLAKALEQFLLTLISQESKFDRAARKVETLTAEEQRGLQLFVTENDPRRNLRGADCFHCHGGNLFTNHQFHNNGLSLEAADSGRFAVTHQEEDRGKFKTPSLRNIALTAPYMHDGRFATLEEVIEHYDHGVLRSPTLDPNLAKHPAEGLNLSAEDKKALAAFLRTLTDPTLATLSRTEASKSSSTTAQ